MTKEMSDAYVRVNGVSADVAKELSHAVVIEGALLRVWEYEGLFPNEDTELRQFRYTLTSPAEGSPVELADYFRQLDNTLSDRSDWETVYLMYNCMIGRENEVLKRKNKGKQDLRMADSVQNEGTTVSESSHKNNHYKEVATMGKKKEVTGTEEKEVTGTEEKEVTGTEEKKVTGTEEKKVTGTEEKKVTGTEELDKLQQRYSMDESDIQSVAEAGAMPSDTLADDAKKVAADMLIAKENERKNYSENSRIIAAIISGPQAGDVLVDKEPMGYIKDPQAVINKINTYMQLIGEKDDHSRKAAQDMLDLAVRAANGEQIPLNIHVSEAKKPIKGVVLKENNEGAEKIVKWGDLPGLMLDKSIGVLFVGDMKGPQAVLRAVTRKSRTEKGARGTGEKSQQKEKKAGVGSIASVGFTDRETLCTNYGKYWKELTPDIVEDATGMKSEICFKYQSTSGSNAKGEPIMRTYRIPLVSKQYKLMVVEDDLRATFGDGTSTVGRQVQPVDTNDKAALDKKFAEIASITMNAIAHDIKLGSDFVNDVETAAHIKANKEREQQAADFKADTDAFAM